MSKNLPVVLAAVLAVAASDAALAYVGPGAGLSLIGALWGLLLALLAAVGFIILWPMRRYRRRRAEAKRAVQEDSEKAEEQRPVDDRAGREAH